MHDMGFGFDSSFAHRLVGVHPVEPDTHGIGIIWITIGERSRIALRVPFLAARGAGMATDTSIEVDDETEFPLAGSAGSRK